MKSRRLLKGVGWTVAGMAIFLIVAAGLFVAFFDWNWLKSPLLTRLTAATGRKIEIRGDIHGDYSLTPSVVIEDLHIANAPWSQTADMISIGRLQITLTLRDLLRGKVVIPELAMKDAHILMEKNERGEENWKLGATPAGALKEAAVPDDRQEIPRIGLLSIEGSDLRYRDATRNLDILSKIEFLRGQGEGRREIRLAGRGSLQDKPFSVTITAGPLDELTVSRTPYPLDVKADIGDTHIHIRGTTTDPIRSQEIAAELSVSGKTLADLYLVSHLPLPPSPPYQVSGNFSKKGDFIEVKDLKGKIGDSDLGGHVRVDLSSEKPRLTGDIHSKLLDSKDIATLFGARLNPESDQRPKGRLLPNTPIPADRLDSAEINIRFVGQTIKAPNFLPLEAVTADIHLEKGRLRVDPLSFAIAGGTIFGRLQLEKQADMPGMAVHATIRNIALKSFFRETKMMDLTSGIVGGSIDLAGSGVNLADILGSGNGRLTLAMTGGALHPLIVEAIGLDIAEVLGVLLTPKITSVPIRCLLGDISLNQGVGKIEGLVVDTTDSTIWAEGGMDLKDERLAIRIHAIPKDVSLLSVNAPIAISGTFADPRLQLDSAKTAGKGGVVEFVGRFINPLLAFLPFFDLGLGEDTDCRHFDPETGKSLPAEKKQ